MSELHGEPSLGGGDQQASQSKVKFNRNAKGETQIEVQAVLGVTQEEMTALRTIAFETYKGATEAAGLRIS